MEDHDLKEAIKCEKAALRAEREAMREERLAFAAELEQIRKERAELHAEKERIQAEREALKTASEIARKIQQRTGKVYKGRKKISGFDVSRVNGVCNPKIAEKIETPIKLTPYKQEKYIILDSLDRAAQDRNWKSGPKTRLKQKIQCLAQTENKEGSSEGRAGLNSWPKRKKNCAALRTEKDRNENISKTRQQLRYNMLDSGDSERNATPLRVSEEEDFEDLKVSFDKPGVSLIRLPASQVTKAADSNVAEAMDVNVSACGLTAKPDRPRGISSPTCKDCGRSFRWTSHYLNHLKSHTAGGDKSRQCEVLGRINHLAVRMPKQHVCSHCALTFTTLTTLQKHVHSNHKQWARTKKEFKCSECREVFTKASSLATHMGVHRNGKPFRCTDCSSAFTSQGNLTVHMRKHRGEKPFKCTECVATFPRLADLRSHSRKHSTVKPYVCCTCPAAFCRPGDLKPHMRTHTGEKPFQCEVCGAAFSTSSNLAVHRRTHTGERPFQCEQCGAAFSQLGHLTRHRTQHAYEHSHRCTSCPATFGNAYHLKVHMQRHNTENTFKCKCGAAFSRASILTEHMRIHTGEKPYKCNQCPAAFARSANLAAHRRKHTGERPYVCPHCQQGFTQSTSLNRHIQSKSACQSRLGQSKSEDAEAEVMETTALGESPQSSSIQRVPEVLELSSSVDGNADRLGSCFFREKPKCLDKYALTAHESGIGDNHFLSATPIVNGATIPLQTLEHWDGMSLPANSEGKMANPDSVRLSDILLVDKPQGERLATASDYPRQQYGDITLQQSAIASTNVAKCGVTERNLPVSSFHSQVNASCTASKNGIFSEGNLSISTSLHPQISSLHITVNSLTKNGSVPLDTSSHVHANSSSVDTEGTVSSVSLHLTGDARSSILLLPPAGTMTDYEEQVRTSAETLIAMKSMSHPSSYFHSHLSSPTRSNLSSTQ